MAEISEDLARTLETIDSSRSADETIRREPGGRAGEESGAEPLRITGVIAAGGMGLVQRAEDPVLCREVAVKTANSDKEEEALRLVTEARTISQVQHPGVVPIYALRTDPVKGPQILMKVIEGEPLSSRLPIPADDRRALRNALEVFSRVCEALSYGPPLSP